MSQNPKILHRIYFDNFSPYFDPFEHYLESWRREMPDYKIMKWNASNLDVTVNEWTRRAAQDAAPVFLSEYFRWAVLAEYGGVYLDADCEIVDGKVLSSIIDELYHQDEYDMFFGVEERSNGQPTAQTMGAKKGAPLVSFMKELYEKKLMDFWPWRETRGLIGPQLMSLYLLNRGIRKKDQGFIKNLDAPTIIDRCKVYPQTYFSPKFSILGDKLDYQVGKTCVYHMFANSNLDYSQKKKKKDAQSRAATFAEYRADLDAALQFPRHFDASWLETSIGEQTDDGLRATSQNGLLCHGPYVTLPRGEYTAELLFSKEPSKGTATVNVTSDAGERVLATTRISFPNRKKMVGIDFRINVENADNVEVTINLHGVNKITLKKIKILKRSSLKILHRIYFGFDGEEDKFMSYLDTWEKQLPDFKIMHWNSSNLPMEINEYVKELHAVKDHAFLTDFFRWYVIREHGGIYLDADVEVYNGAKFRKLVEKLENTNNYDAFIGIDQREGGWYTAHTMASKPGSDLAGFMCNVYQNLGSFTAWRKKGFYFWAPQMTALYFTNNGHNVDSMGTSPHLNEPIDVARVRIYPQDYFSPLAPTGKPELPFVLEALTENTSLCHHFACSWHDADSIYLAHSKGQGGQANTMLRQIAERPRQLTQSAPGGHFAPVDLSTVVGATIDGKIATSGQSGCLIYGPYTTLRAGKHVVTFELEDAKALKGVSCDVTAHNGAINVAKPSIRRESIFRKNNRITVNFTTTQVHDGVEFRLFVTDRSSFAVKRVVCRTIN